MDLAFWRSMQPLPDLSALESEYQILTELHRSDETHTFLARHLELNRDVTVTVIRATNADALQSYDADTKRLVSLRHPNIIPTLEGRFLGDGQYAVVHAHSRGLTLEQTASGGRGLALPMAAAALQQVHSALSWAREHGIENRHVTPDELVFQQGSGRVLLALTPTLSRLSGAAHATAARVPDACTDARTVGELAFAMLSGRRIENAGRQSLGTLRRDLPSALVVQTETLLRCDASGVVPNVDAYIEQFRPIAAPPPRSAIVSDAEVPVPVSARADTAVVAQNRDRGMSFGARFATAIAVLAVLAFAAIFVVKQRSGSDAQLASRIGPDTVAASAAGDIAMRARESDSLLAAQAPQPVIVAPPAGMQPTPQPQMQPSMSASMSSPMTSASAPGTTATSPTLLPPPQEMQGIPASDARRRDLVRTPTPTASDSVAHPLPATPVTQPTPAPPSPVTPPPTPASPVTTPVPATTPVTPPAATTAATPTTPTTSSDSTHPSDICESPAPSDQRRCLANTIERKDAAVNETYQRVVRALRRQANVQPEDPDPSSVDQLRVEQHSWQNERDLQCQAVGVGALFARERAACYSSSAERRMRALQAKLDGISPE